VQKRLSPTPSGQNHNIISVLPVLKSDHQCGLG